jgi:hypothetical protein
MESFSHNGVFDFNLYFKKRGIRFQNEMMVLRVSRIIFFYILLHKSHFYEVRVLRILQGFRMISSYIYSSKDPQSIKAASTIPVGLKCET